MVFKALQNFRIFLVFTLALLIALPALAQELSQVSRAINSGLGRVLILSKSGNGTGSGFVIHKEMSGDLLFVTNAHVAMSRQDKYTVGFISEGGLDGAEGAKFALYDGTIEAQSKGQDLAVLRLKLRSGQPKLPIKPLAITGTAIAQGMQVASFGYPGVADFGIGGLKEISFYQSSLTAGVISRIVVSSEWGVGISKPDVETIQHDAAINKGNSGGPLVNTCAEVVGVNSKFFAGRRGAEQLARPVYLASTAKELIFFLDKHNIPYNKTRKSCDGTLTRPSAFSNFLVGINQTQIAVGGTILLLGLIIGAMVWNHRRKTGEELPEGRKRPRGKVALEIGVEAGGAVSIGLRATAEQLEMGVSIGRDANCDLTLDDPKVSRKHASLILSGRRLLISDLGSANGTFVDEKRLSPNKRVQINTTSRIRAGNTTLRMRKPQ